MQNTPIFTNRYVATCSHDCTFKPAYPLPPIGFNSDRLSVVTIRSKCGSKHHTRIAGQHISGKGRILVNPFVKVKAEPVGRDPFTDITNTTGITNTTDITNTNGKEDQSTPRQPTGVEMVNNADADWWSELVTRFDCLLSQNTNRFDKIEAPISSLSTSGVPIAKQTKGEKNIIKV